MRYFLSLCVVFSFCVAAQALALRSMGGRFVKSESNYFSSLARIQAGATVEAETMLLGSSITGRLPDRAQGFAGWANMGCDGGSAVDVLRAMDEGILPAAPRLVIEANTLHLALRSSTTEISGAMRGFWFRAGIKCPMVSAYARPSAYFYSLLLARKIGAFDTGDGPEDLGEEIGPMRMEQSFAISGREEVLVEELVGILNRLGARGSSPVFVWLPPRRPGSQQVAPWITELARRSGALWWDLGAAARPGNVQFTDGVHMSAPSAARTMNSIIRWLPSELESAND